MRQQIHIYIHKAEKVASARIFLSTYVFLYQIDLLSGLSMQLDRIDKLHFQLSLRFWEIWNQPTQVSNRFGNIFETCANVKAGANIQR